MATRFVGEGLDAYAKALSPRACTCRSGAVYPAGPRSTLGPITAGGGVLKVKRPGGKANW
jgi:hypothetical protein